MNVSKNHQLHTICKYVDSVETTGTVLVKSSLNCRLGVTANVLKLLGESYARGFHVCAPLAAWASNNKPTKWPKYNKVIHPPQLPDEEPRPAVSVGTNVQKAPY